MARRILIIMILVFCGFTARADADHLHQKDINVLLLHSYHHGFSWSDSFTEGLREELARVFDYVHLDIQYLDEKRVLGRKLWPSVHDILKVKYANHNPDLIVAVDDAALQFLLHYSDQLFVEVPVVFAGLSHFEERWRDQRPALTGLVERLATLETVELARTLHPQLQRVVVVNDSSLSGLQRHVQAILALEPLAGEIETEFWIDVTLEELQRRTADLDAQTLLLLESFYRDTRGVVISGDELAGVLSEVHDGPVYVTHAALFGSGAVGGIMAHGNKHGALAAILARRVYDGEFAGAIPVDDGPLIAQFDYAQLESFKIGAARLPAGSVVYNQPQPFWVRHPQVVELLIFVFMLSLIYGLASSFIGRVRKKASETLEQNYALLQTIVDSIPDPIFYKDKSGRYLGGNRAFCEALGFTKEQIIGRTVYEVVPTERAQAYHRADMELLAQGGTQTYETQVRFADGLHHDVLFHKAVFNDDIGGGPGMVGVMLDITQRKESEERFRTLFETSPDPIVLAELEGTIIDVNRGFEEQSGISREQALGKSSLELGLWNDPGDRDKLLTALRSKGVVNNYDFRLKTHRGVRNGLFSARLVEFGGKTRMLFVVRDITDLRRTEQALEQSELRLRTVFDASPDAILLSRSGGGGIIDVNRGFTRLWGYEREEVLWRSTVDLNLWANLAEREQLRNRLHREGQVDNFEISILCKDGSRRVCSASCRLLELDGGACTLAVFRDITPHKEAEEALLESEQKFHAVFHQTYQFMGILDREGRMLEVNQTALALYGHEPVDYRGKYFWEAPLWQSEEHQNMVKLAIESASRGNLFRVRTSHKLPEENAMHLDFSIKPVRDEWGEILYLIPEGRDITGLMVAEQALRESENRYRDLSGQFQAALDGVPDVMMIFDPQGKLVWNNQSAAKTFALTAADIGHSDCRQVWGVKAKCDICRESTFVDGEPWEDLVETEGGTTWGIKTFPVKDTSGKVLHVFQIATDLTEKIHLREQASRSAHLAALGEVAAGVAHEINNPVGLLSMDLGLLQDIYRDLVPIIAQHRVEHGEFECGGLSAGRALEEIPPIFDELLEGTERIRRIVEELKDFANPHAEALEQLVDLNEVVNRALRLTRKSLNPGRNRLEVELAPDLPLLPGNPQRLEQVVINLLLNAAQALEEKGGAILVTTMHDVKRKLAMVSVIDDGCGIPAEKLTLITDPFFTTRRDDGGTGLGLSVSTRIIDEHHGTLNFTSRLGEGTTVTIELPLQKPEE